MRRISRLSATRRPASALVMVILVLAGLLTAVFGAQRLVLVQFNQATSEEDNILALYAAKAGIEDGLIRFRFQRNVETGKTATSVDTHRFDLTDGKSLGEVKEHTEIDKLLPDHQYYDLKINYRGQRLGDFNALNYSPLLAKDEVVELSGFPASSQLTPSYYLRLGLKFFCQAGQLGIAQVESIKKQTAAVIASERKFEQDTIRQVPGLDTYFSDLQASNVLSRHNQPITDPTLTTTTFRLRAVNCDLRYSLATSKNQNGSAAGADAGPEFDTGKTILTATGYFGRAKHTLVGEIDRRSGRLLGVFDFNVFAGGGILPK